MKNCSYQYNDVIVNTMYGIIYPQMRFDPICSKFYFHVRLTTNTFTCVPSLEWRDAAKEVLIKNGIKFDACWGAFSMLLEDVDGSVNYVRWLPDRDIDEKGCFKTKARIYLYTD